MREFEQDRFSVPTPRHRADPGEADVEYPHGHQRFESAVSLVVDMLWPAFLKLEAPDTVPTVRVEDG